MVSVNLAMRAYSPTYTERCHLRASELLFDWITAVLKEFDVDIERDVLTSASDSGSDVRRALDSLCSAMREWCVAHLMNRVFIHAFGAQLNRRKSSNLEGLNVIDLCRETIERVNKSEPLSQCLKEEILKVVGELLRLLNSPAHRLATYFLIFHNHNSKLDV